MSTSLYLTDQQLAARYNVARCTIWRWSRAGRFPNPVQLSPGCTRWRASDVHAWEEQNICA